MRFTISVTCALLLSVGSGIAVAESVTYTYDSAGRLTHAHYTDGSIEYVYDPAGNLLNRAIVAGVSPSPIEPTMVASRGDGELQIAYSTSSCVASDHALFVGSFSSFGAVADAACSVGADGTLAIPEPTGDIWFLIAGLEGDSYSSVGTDFSGERILTGVAAICPALAPDTVRSCP